MTLEALLPTAETFTRPWVGAALGGFCVIAIVGGGLALLLRVARP